jgi:hypothetical protein
MRGPFYISAGGEFPSQSSQPVFITESEFYDCCCSTGCFCYTIYEWDCSAGGWVLVSSGKSDFVNTFILTPPPYDQWNYFYFKRNSPRSNTIIRATYGEWIDCVDSCPTPTAPSAPAEVWRAWKCDGSEPTEPTATGDCQKLAYYDYDCVDAEWDLVRVDIIRARLPKNTEVENPDDKRFVQVFGEVFDCDTAAGDLPVDPGPPKTVAQAELNAICLCSDALDEYDLSGWFQYLDFFSGDATCDPSNLGVESEKRIKDAATVTLSRTTGCEWTASFQIENRNVNGTPTTWALYASGATFAATLSYDLDLSQWTLYVNLLEITGTRIWEVTWSGSRSDPTKVISEAYDCGLAGALYTTGSKEAVIS